MFLYHIVVIDDDVMWSYYVLRKQVYRSNNTPSIILLVMEVEIVPQAPPEVKYFCVK